jgi:hypothetical protein
MAVREIIPPPEGKLVQLGTLVIQSHPLSQFDGSVWLSTLTNVLDGAGVEASDLIANYSWIPLDTEPPN